MLRVFFLELQAPRVVEAQRVCMLCFFFISSVLTIQWLLSDPGPISHVDLRKNNLIYKHRVKQKYMMQRKQEMKTYTLLHGDISDENVLSISPCQHYTEAINRDTKVTFLTMIYHLPRTE